MTNSQKDELEDQYLNGKCFALAYALHQRFGWAIEGKVEQFPDGAEFLAHVWVVHPNGQAFDACGLSDRELIASAYGSPQGRVVAFSEDAFLEFCEVDEDDEFDDFFYDVEEAGEALDNYFIPSHLSGDACVQRVTPRPR